MMPTLIDVPTGVGEDVKKESSKKAIEDTERRSRGDGGRGCKRWPGEGLHMELGCQGSNRTRRRKTQPEEKDEKRRKKTEMLM